VNVKRFAIASLVALFACASAQAHDPQREPAAPIDSIFAGLIQEQDVALAMRYLRDALDAALEGREPPPADALIQRGEVIANEVKRRGAASARSVLDAIEDILRESVREEPRLPPSSPMRRI
jgi:hypothetical protein